MKAKLNRGPMHGKYMETQDYGDRIIVQAPVEIDYRHMNFGFPPEPLTVKRGDYRKSNVQLKNGAWVFEWMGWIK